MTRPLRAELGSTTLKVNEMEELKADFTKALPGGALDDATYEAIETALDKAEATIHAGGRWLTLPDRVAALAAAREEAEQDAHELTKALTGLVGGGSEMFVRKRERFLADIPHCVGRLRERSQNAEQRALNETLRAKAAEEQVGTLLAELHLLEEVCGFYANDEDATLSGDEPYGSIPTEVGLKARAARARFLAREAD